jgi:hypothetical protein
MRPVLVLSVAALLACGSSADAGPLKLQLITDTATTEITDNDAADLDSTDGSIVFFGSDGWSISGFGLSAPSLGSLASPHMDLNFSSVGVGSLTVLLSQTGFLAPGGTAKVGAGGYTDGALTVNTWVDPGNAHFTRTTVPLLTTQSFTGPSYSGDETGNTGILGSAYALTIEAIITHAPATFPSTSSNIELSVQSVPDGGATLFFLGIALGGLQYARRRMP